MERITERLPNGVIKRRDDAPKESAMSHLAYFEDLQEQGRLVELPCKYGDTIYHIFENTVCSAIVFRIILADDCYMVEVLGGRHFYNTDLNKTWFTSKEAAESSLTDK